MSQTKNCFQAFLAPFHSMYISSQPNVHINIRMVKDHTYVHTCTYENMDFLCRLILSSYACMWYV